MEQTWFISDTHFGHEKILHPDGKGRRARPFKSVEEMDEHMVERWNSVVGKGDRVWHLGDFAFGRDALDIAGRLNGTKELILGNHDQYPNAAYLQYFRKLHGAVYLREKMFIMTHVPVHPGNLAGSKCFNIHGHFHEKFVQRKINGKEWINDPRFINVSVEQINYTPINGEEILKRVEEIK